MRLSTSLIFDLGVKGLQRGQQDLVKLQQQISSGRRVVTPADDPVAAAGALGLKQSIGIATQYKTNGDNAKNALSLEESSLADVTTLLQDFKTVAVYAGNPTLSNSDRGALVQQLDGEYQQLLGIANTRDTNGQYLFSGFQGNTQPYVQTAPGVVTYFGDSGDRDVQISAARRLSASDAGDKIFNLIKNGNGTFAASQGSANTGSGVIDPGVITDPVKWQSAGNAKDFTITFDVTAGVTTYDIVDNVNNVSLLTGAAPAAGPYLRTYTPGQAISLQTQAPPDTNATAFDYGANVTVTGTPASGDTFDVQASSNQDIFTTLQNLINTLRTGITPGNAASTATYQNQLNGFQSTLDNSLNKVLEVRAGVGARLKEIESTQNSIDDVNLQYTQSLSNLQDLDYAKAVSDLTLTQTYLQAAQQSFVRLSSLSLFNYLGT